MTPTPSDFLTTPSTPLKRIFQKKPKDPTVVRNLKFGAKWVFYFLYFFLF
jgi:hypothetical protein